MRTGLSRNKHHLIAALDVGSSKICCMIATNDSPERAFHLWLTSNQVG